MILQSLVKYYDILAPYEKVPPVGYCDMGVDYALELSEAGELKSVLTLKEGKVKKRLRVPEQKVRASKIVANFLCENGQYIFGIGSEKAVDCFEACRALHLKILDKVESPASVSVKSYFQTWNPVHAQENSVLKPYLEDIKKGATFVFVTRDGRFIQEERDIKAAWEDYQQAHVSTTLGQCLVTGEDNVPISVLHPKIKGVTGAQSVGANLVSFNARSFESYGYDEKQGLNAPVSEVAAFKYGAVLNYLLSERSHRNDMSGTTVVYWAEDADETYTEQFNTAMLPDEESMKQLHNIMDKAAHGQFIDEQGIQLNTPFYLLGLAPNAARISVRFFYRNTFGEMIRNIVSHYERMQIIHPKWERAYIPISGVVAQTINESAKQKADPNLAASIFRAVIQNQKYPETLCYKVMNRIRAERDVSYAKAAILKAFMLRNHSENQEVKEVLDMALNEESNNKAYVLGRLFARLERVQGDANGSSNIRSRYFSSACTTPGIVFPTLIKLSAAHLKKIEKEGLRITHNKAIGNLMDKLEAEEDPFPARLSMLEQNLFALGYYQQTQAFFVGKSDVKEEK